MNWWHNLWHMHLSMRHEKYGQIMLCTNRLTRRTRAMYYPINPEWAPLPIPGLGGLRDIVALPDEESVIGYLTR